MTRFLCAVLLAPFWISVAHAAQFPVSPLRIVLPSPVQAPAPSHVAPLTGPGCPGATARSPLTTKRGSATILNNKNPDTLKIYWIDALGHWQPRGEVAPRGSQMLSTYVGHRWVVVDQSGKCIGTHIINTFPQTFAH